MINHEIYTVVAFEIVTPYTIKITFDDNTDQTINFRPLLHGQLYGPLQDLNLFNQVRLDEETGSLVWPNGADFDPATLHDWPHIAADMIKMAQSWPAVEELTAG